MSSAPRPQVLIPFVCPVCAGANEVHLISLSRAGGVPCAACKKWLRAADVMRAMHSPRSAIDPGAARMRPARPARARTAVTWPPTAESRAGATPLRQRK